MGVVVLGFVMVLLIMVLGLGFRVPLLGETCMLNVGLIFPLWVQVLILIGGVREATLNPKPQTL